MENHQKHTLLWKALGATSGNVAATGATLCCIHNLDENWNRFCSDHNPPWFVEDMPNPHPTSASKHATDKTFLQKKKWSTQARATPCARTYHLSSVQKRFSSKIFTFKHVGVQHFHLRLKTTPKKKQQHLILSCWLIPASKAWWSFVISSDGSPLVLTSKKSSSNLPSTWAPRTEPKALKPFSKPPKLTGLNTRDSTVCLLVWLPVFGYIPILKE